MFLPAPRGFADPARVAERRLLALSAGLTLPLSQWAESYARAHHVVVPQFDPAEAGVNARVLVVMEAPGPMTNALNLRPGSGFISVDNDDLTAANMWRARQQVGLDDGVLHWNIVPWYLGNASRKPTVGEVVEGGRALVEVLDLLPRLESVILCGRYAQRGWKRFVGPLLSTPPKTIPTWHPSPLALNSTTRRADFVTSLRNAAELSGGNTSTGELLD